MRVREGVLGPRGRLTTLGPALGSYVTSSTMCRSSWSPGRGNISEYKKKRLCCADCVVLTPCPLLNLPIQSSFSFTYLPLSGKSWRDASLLTAVHSMIQSPGRWRGRDVGWNPPWSNTSNGRGGCGVEMGAGREKQDDLIWIKVEVLIS